jgi:hypothetical protein
MQCQVSQKGDKCIFVLIHDYSDCHFCIILYDCKHLVTLYMHVLCNFVEITERLLLSNAVRHRVSCALHIHMCKKLVKNIIGCAVHINMQADCCGSFNSFSVHKVLSFFM